MYRYEGIPCPDPSLPAGLTQRDIDTAYGYLPRRRTQQEEFERGDKLNYDAKDAEATSSEAISDQP